MKRLIAILLSLICVFSLAGCATKEDNKVVIYSSDVEFSNEHVLASLKKQFPSYEITLQYLGSGNNAAKLKAEGTKTDADIVLALESGYLESIKDYLAPISDNYYDKYLDEMIPLDKKYIVWERFSGCIAVNSEILAEKNLTIPKSYNDLLKPEYKGLISMPNPKSSGTGYIFLKNLVNVMGEDEAFKYFEGLSQNILQFTSSGSGPVNALVQGEAAIGLGMTFQAVNEINKGLDLQILYFSEGAPYTIGGMAMIEGKQNKQAVKKVFDFIYSTLIYEDKELFVPEAIFKNQDNKITNYPLDIPYADMTGINDIVEKERLLEKWDY